MKTLLSIVVIVVFGLLSLPSEAVAQKKQKAFIDTLDNALDISYYLGDLNGLLPVISPITEPAVGYGAAVAGVFFFPKEQKKGQPKKFRMPDVAGIAGGYTENSTWFGGLGYMGFWNDDRIRYRGVFGYGDINLKYYGTGDNILSKNPLDFNIQSYFLLQQMMFRLGETNFLLGGKYQLMKTKASFEIPFLPSIDPIDYELLNSGLGIITEYDKLNNIFSPTKGMRINLTYDQYLEVLGGDRNFSKLSFFVHDYHQVIENKWNAGFRIESLIASESTPFYMLPFISLRGVPAMRYQGEFTALIETEQEVMFGRRWSIVGFGGYGSAFKSLDNMSNNASAWNAGLGFRYLLARMFGLKMGLDVARGPEQYAIYVVFGNSWLR